MKSGYFSRLPGLASRFVGLLLLLFAGPLIAFALGAGYEIFRNLRDSGVPEGAPIFLFGVIAGLALFCAHAGYRLFLDRPSASGTMFSATGWTALAIVFGGCALVVIGFMVQGGTWRALRGLLYFTFLSGWCFYLAHRARVRRDSMAPSGSLASNPPAHGQTPFPQD